GGTVQDLKRLVHAASPVKVEDIRQWAANEAEATSKPRRQNSPWERAVPAPELVRAEAHEPEWIAGDVLAPGSVTVLASPRGLGKTHAAHALAIAVATGGTFRGT